MHTRTHTLLPAGCIPKPLLASLNHQGKVLVEAEQNEMKINMAEQRLQPRTRYHSPRWKTHHKLLQIILWNFGKNSSPLQQKIG